MACSLDKNRRHRSDSTDALADSGLHWSHMSMCSTVLGNYIFKLHWQLMVRRKLKKRRYNFSSDLAYRALNFKFTRNTNDLFWSTIPVCHKYTCVRERFVNISFDALDQLLVAAFLLLVYMNSCRTKYYIFKLFTNLMVISPIVHESHSQHCC